MILVPLHGRCPKALLLLLLVLLIGGCRRSTPSGADGGSASPGTPASEEGKKTTPQPGVAASLLPLLPEPARTVPVTSGSVSAGLLEYLDGLERLEAGQWQAALAAFHQAVQADGDRDSYHLALGVAATLAERFPEALEALDRAGRLTRNGWETKLWMAAAYRMSGDPRKGAMLYSAGNEQTKHYANLVYNEMAMEYWSSKTRGQVYDAESRSLVPAQGVVRRKFPQAAAWLVRRAKSTTAGGDLSGLLFARARDRYARGEYRAAMTDLQQVQASYPEDRNVLSYHAACSLALGDAVTARQEYTRLLTFQTQNVSAYLGRALASARLGDAARAQADLAVAGRLDAGATERTRPDIERALQEATSHVPDQAPEALLAAVEQAVRDRADDKTVGERAQSLQRVLNARRLHYDETYQDGLREREDAVRGNPGSADAWAALGKFLYDQSEVFGERVEPRGTPRRFRYQTPQLARQEIDRADKILDQALKIDPNHLRALVARAALCFDQARYDETESLVSRALQVGPNDPELMYLFSELRKYGANWRAARASALRTPDIWSTQSREGDYIVTRTYRRDPSEADLREAKEYERQSQRLYALARQHMERALHLSEGTPLGFYYQALVRKGSGNLAEAERLLKQAIQGDPKLLRARLELIYVLNRLGRADEQLEQESDLVNQVETTAGSMLKLAWRRITTTAWGGARQALARARALDPADARIPAYLAVIAQAEKKPEQALEHLRVALALEEARMNLRGTTLRAGGSGLLRPEDTGLTLTLRNQMGQELLAQGQADRAVECYRDNVALQERLSRRDWTTEVSRAMLPDPKQDPSRAAVADNVMALLAWSHLGLGQAYLAQRQLDAAERELVAVRRFETGLMATESGRERLREPVAWATMGLCRLSLARGNTEAAFQLVLRSGRPWGLSAAAEQEWKRLESEVMQRRQQGR